MAIRKVIIIGGGMCGLATAISLSQALSSLQDQLRIAVYEVRSVPSTLGGPVNLTPKALRCLDLLGVFEELKQMKAGCEVGSIQMFSLRSGRQIAEIDYTGPEGKGIGGYKGWRVKRYQLLQAMLKVIERLPTVEVQYGKKLIGIKEVSDGVHVSFEDGSDATGDIVIGCDGIHSAVRSLWVEPERKPSYSGIATAYGIVEAKSVLGDNAKPFFKDTAVIMSRYGSSLTTFCDHDRSLLYVVLLLPADEQGSREGWKTIGKDQDFIRNEGERRTQESALPDARRMIEGVEDWTLYPVYLLPPKGVWFTERVMLLGDAAHAMAPRGESIGHALEDAIKFARIVSHYRDELPKTSFQFFDHTQRVKTEEAYQDSFTGWKTNQDQGAIWGWLMEWLTPIYIWWTRGRTAKDLMEDPTHIVFPGGN